MEDTAHVQKYVSAFILNAQTNYLREAEYYQKQAANHRREAEYYQKQSADYSREAEYYLKKAQDYEREVSYYTRRGDSPRAQSYSRYAQDAVENTLDEWFGSEAVVSLR